jgi:alkylation response protein AidB-like acyl-CoA dehydrogenase
VTGARALSYRALGLLVVTIHAKAAGADPALAWTTDALARSLLWGMSLIVIFGLLAIAGRTNRPYNATDLFGMSCRGYSYDAYHRIERLWRDARK